jgi:hypothetical protein
MTTDKAALEAAIQSAIKYPLCNDLGFLTPTDRDLVLLAAHAHLAALTEPAPRVSSMKMLDDWRSYKLNYAGFSVLSEIERVKIQDTYESGWLDGFSVGHSEARNQCTELEPVSDVLSIKNPENGNYGTAVVFKTGNLDTMDAEAQEALDALSFINNYTVPHPNPYHAEEGLEDAFKNIDAFIRRALQRSAIKKIGEK